MVSIAPSTSPRRPTTCRAPDTRRGEPFGWIASDFSLLDAIESGIVKVPRVPVDDDSGDVDPRYLDLWENIKGKLPEAGPWRSRGVVSR